MRADQGLMALELLVLIPLVVVLLTLVVALGRYSHARQVVADASAAAARAASLASTPGEASAQARLLADRELAQNGVTCQPVDVAVDVSDFGPGGQVEVRVRCTAPLSSLALSGLPSAAHLTSSSTSPLDSYRSFPDEP